MNDYTSNFARLLGDEGETVGDQTYFHCPFCPEEHEKRKFNVNVSTGVWHCFRCLEGGSAAKFIEKMGDQDNLHLWPTGALKGEKRKEPALTAKQQRELWSDVFACCELTTRHEEMLDRRGIDGARCGYVSAHWSLLQELLDRWGEETLIRGGLAFADLSGTEPALKPRRCIAPGRLLIPYLTDRGQVEYFVGYAACPGRGDDESEADYEQRKAGWVKIAGPSGYPTRVYGTVPQDAPYLVITEGQLKTEAAVQRGFVCVGISGIGNSHRPLVTRCKKQGVQRVIILFDTQLKGQEHVEYAAMRLAKLLLEAGIPTFRAKIPLEPGEEKADIDSFLGTHTARQFAELLAAAGKHAYRLEVEETEQEENGEENESVPCGTESEET